ncbi:sensor histidine kinase [Altererythrobacter indicus]|uniref:histidine kinase n=1 Tax=Altericroceibacterium indicum TaxID=374177 RepID=A0A845A4S1_9SPHN|nr:ATP-binding protein [Altericroceibacterium indicum]MXP25292.1 sensor histidine kinase [Altericroceibacterium indicum]
MRLGATSSIASAITDQRDWLIEADEPLAGLQRRRGGTIPGIIAIPSLLEVVRKARETGLKLSRPIVTIAQGQDISAWVEVYPGDDGCQISVVNWDEAPSSHAKEDLSTHYQPVIERYLAGLIARIGASQEILSVQAYDAELEPLAEQMREAIGRRWTELMEFSDQDLPADDDWRQFDRIELDVEGSARSWMISLIPLQQGISQERAKPTGFDLLLLPSPSRFHDDEEEEIPPSFMPDNSQSYDSVIGREIGAVLRQPITRIIANAETIRTQMAGPLAHEYANYAADIASAGEHLLGLLDDLADLEIVESESFVTSPDRIDLADVARQASGILNMRAMGRGMIIHTPRSGDTMPAIGEFRRVLQILLNVVGNAIAYSPDGSEIWIKLTHKGRRAIIMVEDQGAGLSPDEQNRLFKKFERLGRKNDGGSGLGLYISRRLARAMAGDLTVESVKGEGARFILDLPAAG